MPDTFQVVTMSTPHRVLFDGTEEDARAHVEKHFPRFHIEPGVIGDVEPDVALAGPDSNVRKGEGLAHYNGTAGWSDDEKNNPTEDDTTDDEEK